MSHLPFLGVAGWVGRVPPGIKEFLNSPFLVLKARHPVIQESIIMCSLKLYEFHECNINYVNDLAVVTSFSVAVAV